MKLLKIGGTVSGSRDGCRRPGRPRVCCKQRMGWALQKIRSYKDLQLSSQVRLRGAEYPFGL